MVTWATTLRSSLKSKSTPTRASSPSASAAPSIAFCWPKWQKRVTVMWSLSLRPAKPRPQPTAFMSACTRPCLPTSQSIPIDAEVCKRVHSPVLTNISVDWNGLPVTEVYPREVRDLFSAKPIIITGRFTGAPAGKITIKGYQGTGDFSRSLPVDFSAAGASNAALEKIWARHKVEDLMSQDWNGIQQGNSKHKAEIIQVGLTHSLATQYTSFVAVEEKTVVRDGKPVRIEVPVELPQGVSPLAVPGRQYDREVISAKLLRAPMVAGGS